MTLAPPNGKGIVSESTKTGITKEHEAGVGEIIKSEKDKETEGGTGMEVPETEEVGMAILVGPEMEAGGVKDGDPGTEGLVGGMAVSEKEREGKTEAKIETGIRGGDVIIRQGIKRVPIGRGLKANPGNRHDGHGPAPLYRTNRPILTNPGKEMANPTLRMRPRKTRKSPTLRIQASLLPPQTLSILSC